MSASMCAQKEIMLAPRSFLVLENQSGPSELPADIFNYFKMYSVIFTFILCF